MLRGALFGLFTIGMTGASLQFAILNTTTIENLSRKNFVWTLAIYMPKPPEVSPGFHVISYAKPSQPNVDAAAQPDTIRTFAILHTKPGENPFDLGPLRNFQSVMGEHWYDWFFPLKMSPCCDHDREEGQFAMGPVVQRMREEAGIAAPDHGNKGRPHGRHRRRRRRRRGEHDRASRHGPEKVHVGHDRYNVDLESGLGITNGVVH